MNIKLKRQYFSNKISACKGNVKDSWKTINELLSRRSKSCNIDSLKDSDKEARQRKHIQLSERILLLYWRKSCQQN